jgi:hypothetical protein
MMLVVTIIDREAWIKTCFSPLSLSWQCYLVKVSEILHASALPIPLRVELSPTHIRELHLAEF